MKKRLSFPAFISFFFLLTFQAAAQCPPTVLIEALFGTTVISGNNVAFCSGDSCRFTVTPSSGVTYQWYRNSTAIPQGTSYIYYPTTGGDYHVIISGSGCGTPSTDIHVSINPQPTGTITVAPLSPVCSGTNVTVTLNTDFINNIWNWNPPYVGFPITFVAQYLATTMISANIMDNVTYCSRTATNLIIVHNVIDPGIISSDQIICSGMQPSLLTGTSPSGGSGIYTFQWQFSTIDAYNGFTNIPGAVAATYQPPILTQTTWYRRATNSLPCPFTVSNPVQITVNQIPVVTPATKSICSWESVNFPITSNVPGATYSWTGQVTSGVPVSGVSPGTNSGPINDILYLVPGGSLNGEVTYTITPTGPAPTYCVGIPSTLVVTVKPLPIPVIGGPTSVCFGSTGNVYSTAPGKANYTWTISGGTIISGQSTNSITVNWTTAGAQWVRVTYSENGCAAATPTQYNVTVNPLPVPVIIGPNPACAGSTGNLYSTAAGMTNYGWVVSGGGTITGGGGTSDNNVTVTWNTSGAQWLRVTYTDANGCTNTSPTQFNVNVSVPALSGPQTPCLGSTNSVYTTDAGMTNYQWSVSAGGTITSGGTAGSSTATVTWNAAGLQSVTVNYTSGAGCIATIPTTISINVQPLPTPTLSGNNDVCAGSAGNVYTTQTGQSLYTWTISGGGTITGGGTAIINTATVTWNTPGAQWVRVNYTDAYGCAAASYTQYNVTVKTLPVPVISGSTSECAGTTGVFYTADPGKTGYSWTISSGGTITSATNVNPITVTWTTAGSRWVAVNFTDVNGCAAATPTQYPVTVKPLPIPTFINGASSVCINATNVMYETESGMSNYIWTVSSGGTITGVATNNIVYITWNSVGAQTVSVNYTGTNGCTAASASVYNVTVNPLPSISITGPNDVCANSAGNIYTTQPGMTGYAWIISAGGTLTAGGTSTSNTATITWNTAGPQNVSVNYSQVGCPAVTPAVRPVTVTPLPTSDAGPDQPIPYGTSTTLTGSASGGTGTLAFEWTPASYIVLPNTTNPVITQNLTVTPIVFTFKVTDSKGCIETDNMQVILNGTGLAVLATANPQIICNNGTTVQLNADVSGGNSAVQHDYSWTSTPAGFTSTLQNPVVNPTQTTTYHVSVYDGYNTATNSVDVTVNPLPTVFNVAGGGEYCSGGAGLPVSLTGSQLGVSYQLFLNGIANGSPEAGTGSAFSFGNKTVPGTYTVLAVNSTTTCQQNMAGSVVITVNPLPTAYAGADQTIAHGISTTLIGSAGAGTIPLAYLWTPGTMIATGATTLSPTTTNIYSTQTFTLTVTDSKGCTQSDQMQAIVNGTALGVVAGVNSSIICNGSTAQLTSVGSGGSGTYTFLWTCNPPGSPPWSSTEQNPLVTPSVTTLYTVTVNDGFNTATASVTVIVNPLPAAYTVTGGGSYCSGGTGVLVGLSSSDVGVDYQLYRNGSITGSAVPGTGASIGFGSQLSDGNYTVIATRVATGCANSMTGTVSISIVPLPDTYSMTGGGSYPSGGIGMIVGLTNSQLGINYRLIHNTDTLTPPPGVAGTGSPMNFGYQTLAGSYTAAGKNPVTGCQISMLGSVSVTINPYPSLFMVFGGDTLCLGDPGVMIGLNGSEIGIRYVLRLNGDSIAGTPGTGDTLVFGPFTAPGIYTVKGITVATGLYRIMTGSATIVVNPLPIAYLVVPQGDSCPGTEVLINGSQSGVRYYLITGTDTVSWKNGTGAVGLLSFGNQFIPGVYRVTGVNMATGCKIDMLGNVTILPAPSVFDLNPPGILCPGQVLTLSGSETGILYQLRRDSLINVGPAVPGTGSSMNFGPQSLPGFYRVIATNPLSHCYSWQNGRPSIQPGPVIFTIIPNGDTCAGGRVRLNGSQIGIYYHLILNNTVFLDSLYGTGLPLVFGTFTTTGNFKVLGVDTLSHCEAWMDGEVNVFSTPVEYNIIPNGIACEGEIIGLDNSQPGVDYTLLRNNVIIAGGPIAGTGFPISFGIQNVPGDYTIEANIAATGCSRIMSGITHLFPRPVSFILYPQGNYCAGTDIYLNGSQTGVNYELLRGGMVQQTLPGTGALIDFGAQYIPGVYTIKAVNILSTCDTLMTGSATIIAAPLSFNITPAGANCSPAIVGLTGSESGVNYQLIRNGAAVGSAMAGTGNALSFGSQTEGTYRIVANSPATSCSDTMAGTVIITPGPSVSSGNDTTICATHSVALNASGLNYSTIHWYTSGDGTFSRTDITNPIYYPGDADTTAGTVFLSAWVHGLPACPSSIGKDTLILSIHPLPAVNAGRNDTICTSQTYALNGTARHYAEVLWSTSGDGHFDNTQILTPVYTVGAGDKIAGQVALTVTVHGSLQCQADTAFDTMILHIEPLPVANAGMNDTICENVSYRMSGTTQHSSSVLWTTMGDGTFDNPVILTPFYTPGPGDKSFGSVGLILTSNGALHCNSEINRDTMLLVIDKLPQVFAGNDDTICANQQFSLNATVQRQSSVAWTTSGDGGFDDIHSLTAKYAPGPSDISSGQVMLKLTAWGTLKCVLSTRSDSLILRILPLPVANAGTDILSCSNVIIPLSGSATNFDFVTWASLGDGTFDNTTILNPNYTPGANDITAGHVFLSMTANGQHQCGTQFSTDTVRLDFRQLPTASIGGISSICEGETATILFSLTGTAPWSFVYTDGTASFPVNNILLSPYSLIVNPIVATTYSIVSMHDAYCSANLPIPQFTVNVYPKPNTYNTVVTNGGGYCEGGTGVEIGIDGSQPGIFYQLQFGGIPSGLPMPGTGSPISFGLITVPGNYKVKATHAGTLCVNNFPDSVIVVVFPTPSVNFTIDSTCYESSTQFHLSGADISKIALWNWDFGDGNTASFVAPIEPNHLYQTVGTFSVSLSVTDTNGCQKTIVHPITVSPLPIAHFAHNTPLCFGNSVNFTDHSYSQGSTSLRKWHWNFGDGKDTLIIWPGDPNISHLYENPGPYDVILTVYTDNNCHSSTTNPIQVIPAPLANFDHGDTCEGQSVLFTDLSQPVGGGSIVEWSWNFGDPGSGVNNSSTLQNATHLYQNAGDYQVRLIVISSNGCRDTIVKRIQIYQKPIALFTALPACELNPTQFTDNSIPNSISIIEWNWDFGDGSPHSNIQNPAHTYPTTGSYLVTLTIVNSNGCTHAVTKTVEVLPLPVAAFSISAQSCAGVSVQFTDYSTASHGYITTWTWDFGDGSPAVIINYPGPPNVTHTYATTGTFPVTLTVQTDDLCSSSIGHTVTVTNGPLANYDYAGSLCKGSAIQFTDLSQTNGGGTIISWLWNFDDPASGINNTSSLPNPSHTYTGTGNYNVTLTVTNVNTCINIKTQSILINQLPMADFDAGMACFGTTTTFTDLSVAHATGISSWDWDFGDNSVHSTIQNPTHLYSNPGLYNVRLQVTNTNQCTHDTTIQIEVVPNPVSEFSWTSPVCFGAPVSFTNLSTTVHGTIVSWTWDFGDGTTQTIPFPASPDISHIFAGTAMQHLVRLTALTNEGCSAYKEHTVLSNPKPVANYSVQAQLCAAHDIQFTDQSQSIGGSPIVSWNWNFGDPASGTANLSVLQNPVHNFISGGPYDVTLIITNQLGCKDTIQQTITIGDSPIADFANTTPCFGSSMNFTDLSIPNSANMTTWVWTFGDGNTVTIYYPNPPDITHQYSLAGSYPVTLNVTNSSGCSQTIIKTVTVLPAPFAEFNVSSPNCTNTEVLFTDISNTTHGYITQWYWEFGDGNTQVITNPTSNIVPHVYTSGGPFDVNLTITTSDGCIKSVLHTIMVDPQPVPNYGYSSSQCLEAPVQFTDLSQTAGGSAITQWHWTFGDPGSGVYNISTLKNPTHQFTQSGSFLVKLLIISANSCRDSITKTVTISVPPFADFSYAGICSGSPMTFTDLSVPNSASMYTWDWNFGDGTPHSNLTNPTHNYLNPGPYNVTLQVKNSNQCLHDTTISVNVLDLPNAAFASNAPLCVGEAVNFVNQSTTQHGFIARWIWEFGDGTAVEIKPPGVPNISHVFQGTATQHNVRLTVVTNDSCLKYVEHLINSSPAPMANFSNSLILCKGVNVDFTDLTQLAGGGPISTWNWNFGDPASGFTNISSLQNPSHAYSTAGQHDVRLIVSNAGSCRDTVIKTINIMDQPLANYVADTACLGTLTHFTDQSGPTGTIVSWDWDFGDGTPHSHIQNATHLYATPGIFPVTLTVTNSNGCVHTISKLAKVNAVPVSAFSFAAINCSGAPVAFNDLSHTIQGYIVEWHWVFDDGHDTTILFPGPQNVTHVYANGGTYNVSLTVTTNDGCINTVTHPVTVGAGPLANFDMGLARCQQSPVNFQDLSQLNGGGPIIGWSWDFGDPTSGINNHSNLQNPSHIYANGGNFTVKLLVTNINNCIDTINKPFSINSKPSAHFIADTVCKGDSTHFTDQSVAHSGTLISWNWNFGDGTTSPLQNPRHAYATDDVYTVTLTVENSDHCVSDTTGDVLVTAPPVALFSAENACAGSSAQFTDMSSTPTGFINAWLWDFGDPASGAANTSILKNPTHVYSTYGSKTVTLTVTNTSGCTATFSMPVSVYLRPAAAYSYFSQHCPSGKVSFNDHSTTQGVPIVSWLWTFEAGHNSSVQNPVYIFPVIDTIYMVSLVVTDANGCKDTLTQGVNVVPGSNFTFAYDSVCYGKTTHFRPTNLATGDTLHDLHWNFGDPTSGVNNQSIQYYPAHEFTSPGTYIVKLSAYNSDNCHDSVFREVIVYQNPLADFSFDTIPYCDSTVTFKNLSLGNSAAIDSLIWRFGDGTKTIQKRPLPATVVHKYLDYGSYPVTLRIVNLNGCVDSITKNVQVSCIAAFIKDPDTLKCQQQTVTLKDSSGPVNLIRQWKWDFGDQKDTTYFQYKPIIRHSYDSAGYYTVILVVSMTTNGITITDTSRVVIHVKSAPFAAFTAPAVCFGDSTRFVNLSDSNGYSIISNYWKFGDVSSGPNDSSALTDPSHLFTKYGKYKSMLVVKNILGCRDTLKQEVKVYKLPDALFTSLQICSRHTDFFTDKSKPGDTTITNWLWAFGDKTSNQDSSIKKNPTHIYNYAGKYAIYLKVKDYYGCSDTIRDTTEVLKSPISAFTYKDNVGGVSGKIEFFNQSQEAIIWDWNFGNGTSSTEENPTVQYTEDGTFTIKLTVASNNTCEDTTTMNYSFIFRGLYVPNLFSPTNMINQVRLFKPVGVNLSQYLITVYDFAGHNLWESSALDSNGRPLEGWDGTVNGNLMPQGTYMWKISATFKDGRVWEGSNTGKGSTSTMGTVTLVR